MKIKLTASIAIAVSMLTGCSLTEPTIIYIDRSPALTTIESSQHVHPKHIRNGVIVKQNNIWTMREGNSFSLEKPINQLAKRSKWNLPDDAIKQYVKTDEIAESVKSQNIEPAEKTQTKANKNVIAEKDLDAKERQQIHLGETLPAEYSHDFLFKNKNNELNNESRERLRHISPHSLLYSKVEIVIYKNGISGSSTKERAQAIKDELIRAGFRKEMVTISFKSEVNTDNKATVKFTGKMNDIAVSSSDVKTVNIEGTNWVRIIAGQNSPSWLSDALKVKRKLLKKGLDASKVTILHRKQTGTNTSALVYKIDKEEK